MLEISRVLNQLRRKIAVIILASLLSLISLPAASAHAVGYYSGDYSSNTHVSKQKMGSYANTKPEIGGDDYIESGKRAAQAIPQELETGSRQKNPVEMLKRAGEELGNDQVQRAFGAKDYNRSPVEKELARNQGQDDDDD